MVVSSVLKIVNCVLDFALFALFVRDGKPLLAVCWFAAAVLWIMSFMMQ